MARKKIREHTGKLLLKKWLAQLGGINLDLAPVQVTASTDFAQLWRDHPDLAARQLVVKPDMLFGQRKKNNLVLLNASTQQVEEFIKARLGNEIKVGEAAGVVTHFIVEPFMPHADTDEYYLSMQAQRLDTVINFSPCGGIDIEACWDSVRSVAVPVLGGVEDAYTDALLADVADPDRKAALRTFITQCFRVFQELDFTFMEFNPFTFDAAGAPFPLDMRGELDDCAEFQNARKWGPIEFPEPFGRTPFPEEAKVHAMDAKTGASLKLTVLNPAGRIWAMVAGGGASVVFADTVVDMGYGHELGNYGEYSGAPSEEETAEYARVLLGLATSNPDGRRRALLIGGGIANFTDVAKTFKGIIHALTEFKEALQAAQVGVFVRRAGPNYVRGLESMRNAGARLGVPCEVFGPEVPMTHIIPLAIAYVESK